MVSTGVLCISFDGDFTVDTYAIITFLCLRIFLPFTIGSVGDETAHHEKAQKHRLTRFPSQPRAECEAGNGVTQLHIAVLPPAFVFRAQWEIINVSVHLVILARLGAPFRSCWGIASDGSASGELPQVLWLLRLFVSKARIRIR